MLTLAIAALLMIVALASIATLIDCWIRGRYIFESLKNESDLLDAGFVPVIAPKEQRVRQQMRFDALATPSRLPSQRLAGYRSQNNQPPLQTNDAA